MLIRSLLQAKKSLLPALTAFLLLVSAGTPGYGAIEDPEDSYRITLFKWKPYIGDLRYLDATHNVVGGQPLMDISIGLAEPDPLAASNYRLSIFIDSDANGNTGCILPGFPRGTEFRVDAEVFMSSGLDPTRAVQTSVWQLPKTAAEAALYAQENAATRDGYPARLVASPTFSATTADFMVHIRLRLPTSFLGNTTNANISVLSYTPRLSSVNPLGRLDLPIQQGDRVPNSGEFNTATGTVVNDTLESEIIRIHDTYGDNRTPEGEYMGPELLQVNYSTVGDRVRLALVFEEDLVRSIWDPNASFTVTFDSDRRLETGQIFMGQSIPSWGGDVALQWVGAPEGPHQLYLSYGSNVKVPFGGPTSEEFGASNDAQWEVFGHVMTLEFPKSLLDVFRQTSLMPGYPIGAGITERVAAPDDVRFSVRTMLQNTPLDSPYTDWSPLDFGVLDTSDETALEPMAFTPATVQHLTDPPETANASLDIQSVDYQVDVDFLVIKATIGNWSPNDMQFVFEVHLDADANSSTGYAVVQNGTTVQGSDYLFQVVSLPDSSRAGYDLMFATTFAPDLSDAKAWLHNAWLKVDPPPVLAPSGTPGTVTITVPRSEIPLARDRVNALFRSGRQVQVAGQPPLVTYYDSLPNSGPQQLASFERTTALLSVTVAGSGTGVINSSSGGVSCSTKTCRRSLPLGSTVNLYATPEINSVFTGWSGSCSGAGTCSLAMTDDRSVTGTFTYVQPVRIPDAAPRYFLSVGEALASIPSGGSATVQMLRVLFQEDLLFDRHLSATLQGGYDGSYSDNSGVTGLLGNMTIRRGRVNVENLVVR